MDNTTENMAIIPAQDDALIALDYDNTIAVAERADQLVSAVKKIIHAALSITTANDWCLMGGFPYLQESGATKVAHLFGISTQIHDGYPKTTVDAKGYPTYHYRIRFSMGARSVDCDGSRAANDEFFAGKKTNKDGTPRKQKNVDEIPLEDVCRSAYTNCMNNGIKRLVPGLRGLDVSDLERAGINLKEVKGYVFKEGSKGGNSGKAEDSGLLCEACGAPITQKVASYSKSKFGKHLCMDCQKKGGAAAAPAAPSPAEQPEDYPELPPHDDKDLPF